jgi:hypothetical protein
MDYKSYRAGLERRYKWLSEYYKELSKIMGCSDKSHDYKIEMIRNNIKITLNNIFNLEQEYKDFGTQDQPKEEEPSTEPADYNTMPDELNTTEGKNDEY